VHRLYDLSLLLLLVAYLSSAAEACTLYGAQGSAVEGGGTIVGKNRDYVPAPQYLKKVTGGRYEYFGLFGSANVGKPTMRAGVNEKGLVLVTAMAGSIPRQERAAMPRKLIFPRLLANCATVEEAIAMKEAWLGPKFVLLADKKEIAIVEIAPEGKVSVSRIKNDVAAHTNHYLATAFKKYNKRYGESSYMRYGRITQLLKETEKPLALDDFIAFSNDMHDGADNSLWRVGSVEGVSETLGSFIVHITADGNFNVWVRYRRNTEDKGKEIVKLLSRDDIFSAGNQIF